MTQPKPTKLHAHQQSSEALRCAIAKCVSEMGTAILLDLDCFEQISSEESLKHFHQQLLYFVYRLVFLQIAESKGLLIRGGPSIAERYQAAVSWNAILERFEHLWEGDESAGISSIGSGLWEPSQCSLILEAHLTDAQVQSVLSHLMGFEVLVNWSTITSKELSFAFECILELVPQIDTSTNVFSLQVQEGNERKASGAYYTPAELVDRSLQSTLVPAIENAICGLPLKEQEQALLKLTVCDPSCGSGNFLVAAARVLTEKLANIRKQRGEAETNLYRCSLKEVLKHCIYGVDLNPLTVEMCKIVLWLELGIPDQSFDILNNIRCGNALLGATDELIQKGIQTEYFELITPHDDRTIRNAIAKQNRNELRGTITITDDLLQIEPIDISVQIADAVCASLVWPKQKGWEVAPTHGCLSQIKAGQISSALQKNIQRMKDKYCFFHWSYAFPEVFEAGGFDVVVGNPPYLASRYLSKHQPYQRRAIPKLYETASGNWDIYIPFTELGVRILKPGGYQAYVTPNKIIGADYASVLQQQVFFENTLLEVHDYSRLNLFDGANVSVVIVVNRKTASKDNHQVSFFVYPTSVDDAEEEVSCNLDMLKSLPSGFISFPVTASDQSLMKWNQLSPKIGAVCSVSDGLSTDQAYKVARFIDDGKQQDAENEQLIKLVNTGTIDPFHIQWGEKKIKFLGFEGPFPVVSHSVLTEKYPKRAAESALTTVAIAGLATRLEAAVLPPSFLSGVATVLLRPMSTVCPYALMTLLNSKLYSALYKGLFGMSGMTADVLNYSAKQVAQLPLPMRSYLIPYMNSLDENDFLNLSLDRGLLSALGQAASVDSDLRHSDEFLLSIENATIQALANTLGEVTEIR